MPRPFFFGEEASWTISNQGEALPPSPSERWQVLRRRGCRILGFDCCKMLGRELDAR